MSHPGGLAPSLAHDMSSINAAVVPIVTKDSVCPAFQVRASLGIVDD